MEGKGMFTAEDTRKAPEKVNHCHEQGRMMRHSGQPVYKMMCRKLEDVIGSLFLKTSAEMVMERAVNQLTALSLHTSPKCTTQVKGHVKIRNVAKPDLCEHLCRNIAKNSVISVIEVCGKK